MKSTTMDTTTANHQIATKWVGGMTFESEVENKKLFLDADPKFGGEDKGPTPKPLLLVALSGCTGMDTISLLKKMRVEVDDFSVEVTGSLTDEHPRYYSKIHIHYLFVGPNPDKEKIEKAVKLSQERYCGVSYMLGQVAKLTYDIEYQQ